jgi:predicted phosphodiesterase
MRRAHALVWMLAALAPACARDSEARALADLLVGAAESDGLTVLVDGGLAHVRTIEAGRDGAAGRVALRASAPAFELTLAAAPAVGRAWIVAVSNCMPDAVARVSGGGAVEVTDLGGPRPTERHWRVVLPPASQGDVQARLAIAPPDAGRADPDEVWRFAVVSDIQRALPHVDDILQRIAQDPGIRFIVSAGDLVDRGYLDEYALLEQKLAGSAVPLFSTAGNHELISDPMRWHEHFGRFNLHFAFRGVAFSLVDSGNAGIDPLVYEWLDAWLADAAAQVHVFMTHYPPLDPVPIRASSFRSAREAQMLLAALAAGNVDVTFYGHIHSFYAYSNAGIPAYVSGGGGALPERWDGIGRHFLRVEVSAREILDVTMVPVD